MTKQENLKEISVAIMATDGFEEVELTVPKEELEKHGFTVHILAEGSLLKSWNKKQWGRDFKSDALIDDADPSRYDALILPGGVINSDRLRRNKAAIEIVKKFNAEKKLIAAICHGPQLLIEADLVKNRKMTAHHAIKTDMINAGADYQGNSVANDNNFITAMGAEDVSNFADHIISYLRPKDE
ncbi:MAG: type 1 glutamine amidotransferase [Bacteroidales bacterium]|nr:type 1 glutamine amidotransferase [Bacteroidales bacterium]